MMIFTEKEFFLCRFYEIKYSAMDQLSYGDMQQEQWMV